MPSICEYHRRVATDVACTARQEYIHDIETVLKNFVLQNKQAR